MNHEPETTVFNNITKALLIAERRYNNEFDRDRESYNKALSEKKVGGNDIERIKEYHEDYISSINLMQESIPLIWGELQEHYISDIERFRRIAERLIKNIENGFHILNQEEIEEEKQWIRKKWWGDDVKANAVDDCLNRAKRFLETQKNPLSPENLRMLYLYFLDNLHENVLFNIFDIDEHPLDYSICFKKIAEKNKIEPTTDPGNKNQPKRLRDLFIQPDLDYDHCIMVLSIVSPPVVNNSTYLLGDRSKGSIVAWVEALKQKGKIKEIEKPILVKLLNAEFHKLELGSHGRSLSDVTTSAYIKYFNKFLSLIN